MRVAVIGGGIQGCCVALELASRGVKVEVFEAAPSVMGQASRHTEGKIHLGYVYGNDPTLKTTRLMVKGAATFASFMRQWVGPDFDEIQLSSPFDFVVHEETIVGVDQLSVAYQDISTLISESIPDGAYFGIERPGQVLRADPADLDGYYGDKAVAVFRSEEIAVDPEQFADLLTKVISDADDVAVHTHSRVLAPNSSDRTMSVAHPGSPSPRVEGPFDHVINCAWGGRPLLDSTVGLTPPGSWSFRMKYFLRANEIPAVPTDRSSTIVLGPFGDIVAYGNGDWYLSWYPAGRVGWSTDLQAPAWPTRPEPAMASRIAHETIENLNAVRPGLAKAESHEFDVRGGVIYALGRTDVDDVSSGLHQRWDVGTTSMDGWYHSIDTGKYTLAPLFARQAADRVLT